MAKKYTPAEKVFSCCGQYIAVAKGVTGEIVCPRCGKKHSAAIKVPKILIVTGK